MPPACLQNALLFMQGQSANQLMSVVQVQLDSLKQLLASVPGWDMGMQELAEGLDEGDEDAPVIVEM